MAARLSDQLEIARTHQSNMQIELCDLSKMCMLWKCRHPAPYCTKYSAEDVLLAGRSRLPGLRSTHPHSPLLP